MTGNARRRTYTEMFSAGPQHSSVMRHEGCLTTAVRRNQGSALPCWERRKGSYRSSALPTTLRS